MSQRRFASLYTSATYIEGLENDAVTGAQPTFGTLMCIVEEPRGGKGSDEKVVFGIVAAQPSTGEVVYDGTCLPTLSALRLWSLSLRTACRIRRYLPASRA